MNKNSNDIEEKNLTIDEEIILIEDNVYNLIDEINRYIYETKELWDNHISKFIYSSDCLTMEYMGIYDYDKFYNLMINQKTYKLMQISLKRLYKRRNFLIKNR